MKVSRHPYITSAIALAVATSLTGCLGSDGSDGADGQPAGPLISNVSVLGNPVPAGGQVEVHVSAESPEGNELSYEWQFPEGWEEQLIDDGMAILSAPDAAAARGRLEVRISDGDATRTASVQLAKLGTTIDSFSAEANPGWAPGADVDIATQVFSTEGSGINYQYDFAGRSLDDNSPVWTWTVPHLLPGVYQLSVTATGNDESLAGKATLEQRVAGSDPWPMFGGNAQRTGANKVHEGPAEEPGIVWSQGIDDAEIPNLPGFTRTFGFVPLVDREGRLFLHLDNESGDGGVVVAVDTTAESGDSELWRHETDAPPMAPPMLASSGELYTVTENGVKVFAAADEESLLWEPAIDIQSGPFGDQVDFIPGFLELPDGQILLSAVSEPPSGTARPRLMSLDREEDDDIHWEFSPASDPDSITAPAVGPDGTVYVGLANTVYALDSSPSLEGNESERVIWSEEVDGHSFYPIYGGDNRLYVVASKTNDATGYMFKAETGELIWQTIDSDDVPEDQSFLRDTRGSRNLQPIFSNGQLFSPNSPSIQSVNPETGLIAVDEELLEAASVEEFAELFIEAGYFWEFQGNVNIDELIEAVVNEDDSFEFDAFRLREMTMDAVGHLFVTDRDDDRRLLAIDSSVDSTLVSGEEPSPLGGEERVIWDTRLSGEQGIQGQIAIGKDRKLYVVTEEVRVLALQ